MISSGHPTATDTAQDHRALRRKLVFRVVLLFVLLGTASLLAWRLGYFKLIQNGGLRRLMLRLDRVPWIGPLDVLGFARLSAGHEDIRAKLLGSLTSTVIFVVLAAHVAAGLTTGAAHEALLWSMGAGVVLVTVSFAPALVRRMRRE